MLEVDVRQQPVKLPPEKYFNAGIACMAIGIGEVTEKNLLEVDARLKFYKRLNGELGFTGKSLLGIRVNVSNEPRAKWLKRITESFFREFEWDARTKEKEEAHA